MTAAATARRWWDALLDGIAAIDDPFSGRRRRASWTRAMYEAATADAARALRDLDDALAQLRTEAARQVMAGGPVTCPARHPLHAEPCALADAATAHPDGTHRLAVPVPETAAWTWRASAADYLRWAHLAAIDPED